MSRAFDTAAHVDALRGLLLSDGLDCLVLTRHSNLAWVSAGGRSYVSTGQERGEAWLLIFRDDTRLLSANSESQRLVTEEFAGLPWRTATYPWWEGPREALGRLLPAGLRVGVDAPLPALPGARDVGAAIGRLRWVFTDQAQVRARALGQAVAQVLSGVARAIHPGETEREIAGRLTAGLVAAGMDVPVCLVGADERFYQWRHFLPTDHRLAQYVCLVVCARRDGVILSASRLVHFGPPSAETLRRVEAVQGIDAALIAATRPGATAGALFAVARSGYAAAGYPDEWRNHHQGGLAGYEPREWIATPDGTEVVQAGQIFAWNPTLPGAKSEDTILVGPERNEILTEDSGFPTVAVATAGGVVRRPGLLIR